MTLKKEVPTKAKSIDNIAMKKVSPVTSPSLNKKLNSSAELVKKIVSNKPVVKLPDNIDLEDFEQMPTFTIVNINDIINKKDEVVVIEKSGNKNNKAKVKRKRKTENDEDEEDEEYKPESESEEDHNIDGSENVNKVSPKSSTNRRKTQHTKILSDRIKQTSLFANKSTPQPQTPKPQLSATKPYRNIIGNVNGQFKDSPLASTIKPAPRILNSTLCRNVSSTPITPKILSNDKRAVAASASTRVNINNNNNTNNNNSMMLNRSKENLKTYVGHQAKSSVRGKQLVTQSHSGGKRVRKITCFETWFVIKLPTIETVVEQSVLTMSLMNLGNSIHQVTLPSDGWNYHITLQKRSNITSSGEETDDIYTGEVHDNGIDENQKHLYQPVNIMFRRKCTKKEKRMQFDRAIILKNNTFFINVDGKNIKLTGAPTSLHDHADIEILLQIVDDISLTNPFVEQTAYVI